uniref:THAP-type domain-containing protein n=1 Tax=Echeneis naucrates TaxID=173247 RepID=A0A665VV36_ECHNA
FRRLAVTREGFVTSERSMLCSEHFKDFDRTGQIVRLRHGVKLPVFNFPSHLQKHQGPDHIKTLQLLSATQVHEHTLKQTAVVEYVSLTLRHSYPRRQRWD